MNGSAGWAIDLQNTINQNNTPSLGNGLQPYNEVKDTLQKKYPGAFLAGDLTGMVASGYFYGPGSKTADALEAASRKMAPEVVESIAGQKFGKQILRGASVAERATADEAAVKETHALAENNATNSPLLAALDDVIARNPGLARQAAGSYTHGTIAADDAYQAYLRMLDEAEQANKAGMTARDFAKSKGIQSTLTDQQAAFLDRSRIKMLSEDAGKTIKFSEAPYDDAIEMAKDYAKKAPIDIPDTATMKPRTMNNGYEQITYAWRENEYKYVVRWHSRTPGAPIEQGNTWVITRKIPGSGGQKPRSFYKIGNTGTDADWVKGKDWFDAINARKAGTATPHQLEILDAGHWKE